MHRLLLPVIVLVFALAALVAVPTPGFATAILDYDGAGTLMGAQHVEVDGRYYDVRFADRTCAADSFACNATTDFAFRTQAQAVSAAKALGEQVFIDTPSYNFDTDPSRTSGCSGTDCQTLIPFNSVAGTDFNAAFFDNTVNVADLPYNFSNTGVDQYGAFANNIPANVDTSSVDSSNFAIFRPEPFPITFTVDGSGPQNSVSGWFTLSSDILEGSGVSKEFNTSQFDFYFLVTLDGRTFEIRPGDPAFLQFLDANDQPDEKISLTLNDGGGQILFLSTGSGGNGNPISHNLFNLADGNPTVTPNLDYTVFSFYDAQGNLSTTRFDGTLSITASDAVPEPESMPLFITALAGFAAARRRGRRRTRG